MEEKDKIYIAGFVDGEGSIMINCYKPKHKERKAFRGRFEVANTNKPIIEYIKNRFDLGEIRQYKKRSLKHKQAYYFQIGKQQEIIKALEQILPYLKIKQEQAKILIEWCKLRRSSRRNYTTYEMCLAKKIQKLNIRGC